MSAGRSYKLDSIEGLEAAVQDAHDDWRRGDFATSFQKYLAIVDGRLAIAEKSRLPAIAALGAADIVVIEHLSDLASLFGEMQAASDLLEGISLVSNQSGNFYLSDYLLLKRIDLLLGFGKLDESYELLGRMQPRIGNVEEIIFDKSGLQAWESSCSWPNTQLQERALIFSFLYLVMGRILYGFGQYANAIASFKRGIAHTKRFKADVSHHLQLQLSLGLAAACLDKGELKAAENTLLDLESTVRSTQEPWPLVRWLELSAKLDQLLGRLSQAKNALTDVYNICRRYKFYVAQLGAAMNFAHLLILMNQTVRAGEILEDTKKIAEKIGEQAQAARSAFLIEILKARMRSLVDGVPIAPGVIEMHMGAIEPEGDQHPKLNYIPETDNYLARFEDRVLEFHRYLGNSDLERAALMVETTRSAFQLSDSTLIGVRLKILEGMISYYKGEIEKAEALFNATSKHLRKLELVPELWQVQRFLGWCWIRLNRPEKEIRELTERTEELLNQMSEPLSSEDQTLFLLNKWSTEEEFIAGRVNHLSMLKEELASAPFHSRWRKRLRLMTELDALCLHLENYQSKQARQAVQGSEKPLESAPPESFWRRLWNHSRRRCSIRFLVLRDRVVIIRRGWLSLDFGVSSVTRLHLRELIRSWHSFIRMRTTGRHLHAPNPQKRESEIAQNCEKIAKEVADVLQLPLLMKDLPKRIKALSFIPDDVLHGLPFAALRCDGQYLIERFAISTSVGDAKRNSQKNPDGRQALLVNVARGSKLHKIQALPGTRFEVESIRQWLSQKGFQVERLSDDQATKSAVLDSLSNCSLFHIACHGRFVRNRADLSGLILLPVEDQIELLSFVDLSKLDLTRVQHATLSSCWSADNFILPGRWIISLPEALNRAGVHSVLASFWQVGDWMAISFMERFFQYLKKHSRDEALRLTQLDCLHRTLDSPDDQFPATDSQRRLASLHINTSDPFYWANFTLHGEHKKLRLPR